MKPTSLNESSRRGAFTLVEVILAIAISVGLLLVALSFYMQAAAMRGQLLEETEKVASVRLVMDRLTSDLRAAFPHSKQGFSGTHNSMQFTTENVVEAAAWVPVASGRREAPVTDLKVVLYYLALTMEGTNMIATGLERSEMAFPIRPSAFPSTNQVAAIPLVDTASTNAPSSEPFADMIKFARFRYWDGAQWLDDWNALDLPLGVEVNLGFDAAGIDTPGEPVVDRETFRRVIHIPAGKAAPVVKEGIL